MIRKAMFTALVSASLLLVVAFQLSSQQGPSTEAKTKQQRVVNTYNDPQGRFSFQPGRGANVTASGDTVVVRGGNTRWVLQKTSATPDAAIKQTLDNLPTPLKKPKEVQRDHSSFGGKDGVYAIYTGKNAQGKDWVVKIVTSPCGWLLIEDNIMQPLPQLTQPGTIERTFQLTDAGRADAANVPALPPAKDLPALTEALPPLDHPILNPALASWAANNLQGSAGAPAAQQPSSTPGQQNSNAVGGAPYAAFSAPNLTNLGYATTEFIVLFPDGTALGALPAQGLDGFNLQTYLQQMGATPNAAARYQILPDHIELAYSNFARAYALPGAGGPGSLIPLCLCNGTLFEGVYAWGNLVVQFSTDGTFVDRGALDNIVWKWFGSPRLTQGRYALQLNTLYLQTADGRQARISFAAPADQEGSGSFDWIALDQKTGRRVQ